MGFKLKFDSFFSAIGHYLKEVFDDSSVESKVNGTLTLLTPAIAALVNLAGGPGASALVTNGLAQLKADYATLCAVTQGSFPAPGGNAASTVRSLIASLKDNLTAILADSGVKNSKNASTISGYANFFINEAEAILEEFEGSAAGQSSPQPATVTQVPSPAPAAAPVPVTVSVNDKPLTTEALEQPEPATPVTVEKPAPAVVSAGTGTANVKPMI